MANSHKNPSVTHGDRRITKRTQARLVAAPEITKRTQASHMVSSKLPNEPKASVPGARKITKRTQAPVWQPAKLRNEPEKATQWRAQLASLHYFPSALGSANTDTMASIRPSA